MKIDKSLLDRLGGMFLRNIVPERISKHSFGRKFRATKAYADDRQRAPRNRRKNGLRRRRN